MTNKAYYKVQRGMVLWFDPAVYGQQETFTVGAVGNKRSMSTRLQLRHRPWLVVSTNEGNNTADTCNIVPITQESKPNLPCHVRFNYEGNTQTILVEQIRTVDIVALGPFMYILSDDIMKQVELSMMSQFSIRTPENALDLQVDNLVSKLETLILKSLDNKTKLDPQMVSEEQIEDAALRLGLHLEKLLPDLKSPPIEDFSQPKVEEEKKTEPLRKVNSNLNKPMSQVEKFNRKYGLDNKSVTNGKSIQSTTKSTETKETKRNSWTLESRKQFVEDCDNLSPQEVMVKYNLKSVQSVFSTKYNCKNIINDANQK